ncbi:MAG: sigma-70 family RNA polymerase sigma factor [Chloroflexi bacterium]|nr:sigma-70 family RNA polymerase sigma factor [Chloroflexota bacterium]
MRMNVETAARLPAHDVAAVVGAARDGDLAAFGELVRRFQDMAYAAAYAFLGDHHRAQDAAQEAFLAAFVDLPHLREPAAFPGWFRQIVLRQCGRQVRGRVKETLPLLHAAGVADDAPDAARLVEARETETAVRAAIAALPEHERLATALYYIAAYSQAEIAAFLGVPVTTVKKRLFAARRRLKERMLSMVEDTLHQQRPSREERFAATVEAITAVKKGNVAALTTLLDRDPTLVDAQDPARDNQPLLYVAAVYGYSGRIKRYKALVDLLLARGAGQDIFAAAYLNDSARAKALLAADPSLARARDAAGMTALHHAAERGATSVARLLIEVGADVDARDGRGEAPIDHASHSGPWKPGPAKQIIRLLLDHGATVDVFQAAAMGDVARLRGLLDEDPQRVNARDEKNRTPLYEASHNLHFEAVELLLERGADVEVCTAWGETPVSTAIAHSWDKRGPEVVARLRAAGATLSLRDALCIGELERVKELLAEAPKRLHERSWDETPLYIVAGWGHPHIAAYLLELGHELNPRDYLGNTPATLAANFGKEEMAAWLQARGGVTSGALRPSPSHVGRRR